MLFYKITLDFFFYVKLFLSKYNGSFEKKNYMLKCSFDNVFYIFYKKVVPYFFYTQKVNE